jgi:hypothetical protein
MSVITPSVTFLFVIMPSVIILSLIMQNAVMPSVIMLSLIKQNVFMLSVILLSFIMQNAVMLSVIMVSVMAPFQHPQSQSGLRSTEKKKEKKILKFFHSGKLGRHKHYSLL